MNELADFIGRHRGLLPEEENAAVIEHVKAGKQRVKSSRALMCEALLVNGIKTKKISAVSSQLEEIAGQKVDSDLVSPVLLKAAREMLP